MRHNRLPVNALRRHQSGGRKEKFAAFAIARPRSDENFHPGCRRRESVGGSVIRDDSYCVKMPKGRGRNSYSRSEEATQSDADLDEPDQLD